LLETKYFKPEIHLDNPRNLVFISQDNLVLNCEE